MKELVCRPPGLRETLVRIGTGAARHLAGELTDRWRDRHVHVLCDRRVAELFPAVVLDGVGATYVTGGEELKSFAALESLLRAMVRAGVDRKGTLMAIGGGTVGDLGGLAAALCLRGIDLVMVPTTLLAMVDSSVGGKTAIDLPEGKNLVGALWPAAEVWIDPTFVRSLTDPEWRSGLGEVMKVAIGLDPELFAMCEQDADRLSARDPTIVAAVIERALAAKIRVVEADPREAGPRRRLNLGHTLGHALEAHSDYTVPHGVAVARGLHHAIDLAERRAVLAPEAAARCRSLLQRFGFERLPLPPRDALLPFVARDKKAVGTVLHAVLPTAIGRSEVVATTPAEFLAPG